MQQRHILFIAANIVVIVVMGQNTFLLTANIIAWWYCRHPLVRCHQILFRKWKQMSDSIRVYVALWFTCTHTRTLHTCEPTRHIDTCEVCVCACTSFFWIIMRKWRKTPTGLYNSLIIWAFFLVSTVRGANSNIIIVPLYFRRELVRCYQILSRKWMQMSDSIIATQRAT